jgi:hypothetical protein
MSTRAVCFEFDERMSGPVLQGSQEGRATERESGVARSRAVVDLHVRVSDLESFFADPAHRAELGGQVHVPGLVSAAPVEQGTLEIYLPTAAQHAKLMRYTIPFRNAAGQRFVLRGIKVLHTPFPRLREQVTLYTTIYEGEVGGRVWGTGVLRFQLRDLPAFLTSMRAQGASRVRALARFLTFALREIATPATTDLASPEGQSGGNSELERRRVASGERRAAKDGEWRIANREW